MSSPYALQAFIAFQISLNLSSPGEPAGSTVPQNNSASRPRTPPIVDLSDRIHVDRASKFWILGCQSVFRVPTLLFQPTLTSTCSDRKADAGLFPPLPTSHRPYKN
ncbi:hypothetical protein ERIC2_c22300 [Paenibacillus larvae subsp. larvae DSM 25430]|uniref:Uncharacterized protein n=1 Tax=Paenibacillus larvae subsp. larvae DSM 25430 TaxID=697284 RepID=V9WA68_9BACL|nr:hypothetical protein ERIC2_c22300 [Paenibacillus larvae subsp. larvae DSM 25430]